MPPPRRSRFFIFRFLLVRVCRFRYRKKNHHPLPPSNSNLRICFCLPLLFIAGLLSAQTPAPAPKTESVLLTVEGTVQVFPVDGAAWVVIQLSGQG